MDIKFRAIFEIDGSTELRRYLKGCVGGLHYLFSKTADTGEGWMARPHDDEEMWDHIESLNLGIDRDGII